MKEQNKFDGTDQKAVREQSRQSGLSYNEAKEFIARTTGGRGTNIYSDTDVDEVKRKNSQSDANKSSQ
ncbi:hypothetical protein [Lentibacillus sp. CBA3610]|uniref:hypothetical protein n=1 Tax=Lentibacillus sp. CBA3610 TaxID=2518176 RepID=UPI001595D8BC|nr:hypothetical protein [Lentibacillus sp. CBA3610]QKY70094.1 hypothetical protein Len3610_11285 [Lentibacillus sp. CBA3610]